MKSWPALEVSGLGSRAEPDRTEAFQAALSDYAVTAIDESDPERWRVYFQEPAERDRALPALRTLFAELSIGSLDVPDEDWAARSQAHVRAVHVGKIIVAPPWDAPITIVIQPSMGFGTGHHATTRLCLAALQRIEVEGRSVLDVGTGSAVLAIAASRLGAAQATGLDDDADAIHAAWENLALNPGATVTLLIGDLRTTDLVPADIILANLTGGLLIAGAPRLAKLAKAHAHLILSGFQSHEERDVLAAFGGFSVEHREEEDGWLCVTLADR
jgi:ribosomal protein L11 methyltransferase